MLRIKQKKLYDRLRNSQTKIFGKKFLFVYIIDRDNDELAVGLTVSKKVGNAVIRNRIRRRLKAILTSLSFPSALSHFYVNIIAKPDVAHVEFSDIKNEINYLFKKLSQNAPN
jgi:ribonuclease P protein component